MSLVKDGVWQLQEAKAKFSRVVNSALEDGPQLITRSGRPAVYIVSVKKFHSDNRNPERKEVLLSSPYRELDLDLSRDRTSGRGVEL